MPDSLQALPETDWLGHASTCACGGGCPRCEGTSADPKEQEADRAADALVSTSAPRSPRRQGGSLRGESDGEPLPDTWRQQAEHFFDADFSDVRLHNDNRAEKEARDLSAEAFTQGDDISFGKGAYKPGSAAGDRLIAHELAHVVQQRDGGARVQRQVRLPDFVGIARRLNAAMIIWGTDESAIYTALGELGGDQQAGDELKRVYQNLFGQGLEGHLRAELSGAELSRALGLLNPGGTFTPIGAQRRADLQSKVLSIAKNGNASLGLHQDPATGKISGYQLTQAFRAEFDPAANASDYCVIQWVKGEMWQPQDGGRAYWPASMGLYGRGDREPWRFTDWVIDTPDADPRFGSDRGISISVPTTDFDDSPGVIQNRGPLPAGHHWEVEARVGIYPWGAGVPTFVAGWESQRPQALVEAAWGWTVEVDQAQTSLNITTT